MVYNTSYFGGYDAVPPQPQGYVNRFPGFQINEARFSTQEVLNVFRRADQGLFADFGIDQSNGVATKQELFMFMRTHDGRQRDIAVFLLNNMGDKFPAFTPDNYRLLLDSPYVGIRENDIWDLASRDGNPFDVTSSDARLRQNPSPYPPAPVQPAQPVQPVAPVGPIPPVFPVNFDEKYYLSQNPDVAAAVARGDYKSGMDHFNQAGHLEGRNPNNVFREQDYLVANPDVAAQVAGGGFKSGFEHYQKYGKAEGRNPGVHAPFNEQAYLAANPDVAAQVKGGGFHNGFDHFLKYGQREGRNPNPQTKPAFHYDT